MAAAKTPSLSQDYFLPEKEEKSNMAAIAGVAAAAVDGSGGTSVTSAPVSTDDAPAGEISNEESSEKEISGNKDGADDYGTNFKIETAPIDFRFPTTNQTRHCFTRYIEYHRCVAAKGEGASECNKFAKYYRSLCPGEWIEKWNEQRENGTFPGPL